MDSDDRISETNTSSFQNRKDKTKMTSSIVVAIRNQQSVILTYTRILQQAHHEKNMSGRC